jgi:SpoVK/Ycf46/Vps4 family AAA+-type ATPase
VEFLIDFVSAKTIKKTKIFPHLKVSKSEAKILQILAKSYLAGKEDLVSVDILIELYGDKDFTYLKHLKDILDLLELGWITQQTFVQIKSVNPSKLELLNTPIAISPAFIHLLEEGNLELELPEAKPYNDHLEYLQDQFFRIELYQKIAYTKNNVNEKSLSINRLKNKLNLLESRIEERIDVSKKPVKLEEFFKEKKLGIKEKVIFLALLKEEYSASENSLREMNTLIDLISMNEFDRIANREFLEEGSLLLENTIIDYDEILSPFGGISRSFYINDELLQNIIHPQKQKTVNTLQLDKLVQEQEMFELIVPNTTLNDVVLHPKTEKTLQSLLKQMDKKVVNHLKDWGIKEGKKGIDARIMFYGTPGTGKTLTAHSLAKSLKRQILNFDCSKILSMYVGESEKNVRKIFDSYKELSIQSKTEPVLLLNEADQFLSARSSNPNGSADQMYNQMQNIFLEQIENFSGILIATTNLLESLDPAFSRRFNYKLEFLKPNIEQRNRLWKMHLPKNAPFEKEFNIDKLSQFNLTGGQIVLVIKNTAYSVATQKKPLFKYSDFETEIKKELKGNFADDKMMGFVK